MIDVSVLTVLLVDAATVSYSCVLMAAAEREVWIARVRGGRVHSVGSVRELDGCDSVIADITRDIRQ